MEQQRQTLHIIDASSRSRAEQARLIFDLGHHSEVYADFDEFMAKPPERGIVLIHDTPGHHTVETALRTMASEGIWLPVIATSQEPRPDNVVAAIKAGALDYLRLPLVPRRVGEMIARTAGEAKAYGDARRRVVEARNRIANLSPREREVLDWLSVGRSNKMIAKELAISPRTVEIHRANMMAKLGANHSAEAVRLRLEAHLEEPRVAFG